MKAPSPCPNPRRVLAGRQNWAKRRGFTPEGLDRLRAAALANRPWEHATGPRTAEGKSRSAANGKVLQRGEKSVREWRAALAEYQRLIVQMQAVRQQLTDAIDQGPAA